MLLCALDGERVSCESALLYVARTQLQVPIHYFPARLARHSELLVPECS